MPIQNWATISTKIELLDALAKLKRQARVNEEIKVISKPRKGDQNPTRARRCLIVIRNFVVIGLCNAGVDSLA